MGGWVGIIKEGGKMVPHLFLGLGWSEWVALLSIIGLIFSNTRNSFSKIASNKAHEENQKTREAMQNFIYTVKKFEDKLASLNQTLDKVDEDIENLNEKYNDLDKRVVALETLNKIKNKDDTK